MSAKTPGLETELHALFEALDVASAAPATVLKDIAHRERYESLLMFAYRKLQSARHHQANILRLVAEDQAEADAAARRHVDDLPRTSLISSSIRIQRSANAYASELCALLTAIKSGLDFLATVVQEHLTGVTADSISTLMKLAGKGVSGPIMDEVATALPWLSGLRDYRHHLVHRLVLVTTSGFAAESRGGGPIAAARFPVVIPRQTPAFVADTRRARLMADEVPMGVVKRSSYAAVTYDGGREEIIEHNLTLEPGAGYVAIEAFVADHLASYEGFFQSLVRRLISLEFQPVTLSRPAAGSGNGA